MKVSGSCVSVTAHKAVCVSRAGNSLGHTWHLKLSADGPETTTAILHLLDFIGRGN